MAGKPLPAWAWVLIAVLVVFAFVTYINTRDPGILVFAVVASLFVAILAVLLQALPSMAGGGSVLAHVHCPACGVSSALGARHCSACGAALPAAKGSP